MLRDVRGLVVAVGASWGLDVHVRALAHSSPSEHQPLNADAALLKHEHHRPALELWARLRRRPCTLHRPIYRDLIRAAINEGDAAAIVDVFGAQLEVHGRASVHVWTSVIWGLLRCNTRGLPTYQLAYSYWQRLKGSQLRLDRPAILAGMSACIESGRRREAEAILARMRDYGVPPDTQAYNLLLKAAARAGDVDGARRVFRQMRTYGYGPTLVTYNTLMQACVVARQPLRARAVLDKARREGWAPDVVSYTTLMRGLARGGDPLAAEALLSEMVAEAVAPNLWTYSVLIDGYARVGDADAAARLAQSAQASGLRLNRQVYNCIVRAYCRAGLAQGGGTRAVAALLARMAADGVTPGADTYTTILAALVEGPTPDIAAVGALLQSMAAGGVAPDAVTFTCLLKLHAAAGRADAALRVFDEMIAITRVAPLGPAPATTAAAAAAGANVPPASGGASGGAGAAGAAADKEGAAGATSPRRASSGGAASGGGSAATAASVSASESQRSWDDSDAEGSAPVAPPELQGQLLGGPDAAAWSALVDVLVECGRMGEAAAALERAVQAAQTARKPPPMEAFGAMIKGHQRQGQAAPAVALLRRYLQLGGTPVRHLCHAVIQLCLQERDLRTASQVVRAMELTGQPVDRGFYRAWFERAEQRWQQPNGAGAQGAQFTSPLDAADQGPQLPNVSVERLKWWLGLPNAYYQLEQQRD